MGYKAIIDFIAISVPEQFLMALFVWVLLGRKERTAIRNVFLVGFATAVLFYLLQVLLKQSILISLVQSLGFAVLIYFGYKLNILEAALGCLITLLFFTLVQGTTVGLFGVFADIPQGEIYSSSSFKILCTMMEIFVVSLILFFVYKKNINIYYLKENKLDKSQKSRLGFSILQLVFAFFILIVIYTMFINNSEVFKSLTDKFLIVSSFVVTISFTVLLIKSIFKVGEIIQKEEEAKRQMDGREFIQNIDYLCALIDEKRYGELKRVLGSIKNDIESGIIDLEKRTDREVE